MGAFEGRMTTKKIGKTGSPPFLQLADSIGVFSCDKVEDIARKIVERKNSYVEEKIVEAQTVVIEEANKDKADEILKKRLARGEISLDEFHQKIQRT
jgi:hypothetical protein